jgi:hypothetical protein
MNSWNRREIIRSLIGACMCGESPGSLSAAVVHPFCMYSLNGGWSDDDTGVSEYITRQAGANDQSGIPQVVTRIQNALRFRATFEILIAEQEDNAFATVANGHKILVVDVDFLDGLNRMTKTQWAAIQVIAHEIGHHIAGFTADRHACELNADYWSGQSLQRLGSSLTAATRAILTVGTESDTSSHPNKYRRRDSIARGWQDAARGRIDYSHCAECR